MLLIVMSATLDAGPVSEFLGGCPVVVAGGRTHPVSIEYRPSDRPSSPEALVPVVREWLDDPKQEGHLLVFLPGMAEIRRASSRLEGMAQEAGAVVLPLHGSLGPEEQDRALRPSDRRKIVLSTNVAETSLTIEGVRTVIDSGLARSVRYDPARSGSLVAGADQPGVGRPAGRPRRSDRAGALHPPLVGA